MNGDLIKQRLMELEMTPEEFAKKAGFSTATAYNIIAGRKAHDDTVFKAAKALGLKAVELLRESTPKRAV